jgi:hypothetical protein
MHRLCGVAPRTRCAESCRALASSRDHPLATVIQVDVRCPGERIPSRILCYAIGMHNRRGPPLCDGGRSG